MASSDNKTAPITGPALIPTGDYARKPPIPLTRPVTVVGSRNNCRIHLISSTVSKAHCLLVLTDTGCYVADLASRTKTIVNGKPVQEHDLRDGDELTIGRFTFRFKAGRTRPAGRFPGAPSASLQVTGAPIPLPIERRVLLVGRRRSADIPLLEESVSTAHAVIFERDGKRFIRDLGSRTGTFVNRRKVHQEEINAGDKVKIGETRIVYVVDELVAPAPSPLEDALGLPAAAGADAISERELDLPADASGLALEPELEIESEVEPVPEPVARVRPTSPIADRKTIAPSAPLEVPPVEDTPIDAPSDEATSADAETADRDLIDLDVDAEPPAQLIPAAAADLDLEPPPTSADTAIAIATEADDEPEPAIEVESVERVSEVVGPTAAADLIPTPDTAEADIAPVTEHAAQAIEPEMALDSEPSADDLTPRRGWRPADAVESLPEADALVELTPDVLEAEPQAEQPEPIAPTADLVVAPDDQPEPQTGAAVEPAPAAPVAPVAVPNVDAADAATTDASTPPLVAADVVELSVAEPQTGGPVALDAGDAPQAPPAPEPPALTQPPEAITDTPVVESRADLETDHDREPPALQAEDDADDRAPETPAVVEAEIDLAALQQSATRDDDTSADDDADHDLDESFTAAGTLLEPTEPDPASALPAEIDDAPTPVIDTAADSPNLTDSAFAHQVEQFTEDHSTGEVISGAPLSENTATHEPPTPADTISPIDDLPPLSFDEPDRLEEAKPAVAASDDVVSTDPARDEPRGSAEAPSQAPTRDPWGSDRDAFLGGGPLSLTGGNLLADDKPVDPHANDTRIVDAFGVTPPPAADPAPPRKLRGSQRRRRSLRNDLPQSESSQPAPLVDPLAPNPPPITDVFAQPSPFAADVAPDGSETASADPADRALKNVTASTADTVANAAPRRPGRAGSARPQFADRALPGQMPPRRRSPIEPDLDEQAAAERLHHERRRKLRTASVLFVVMLALIGGIAWGIQTYVPVTADVEVAVRFTNLDAMSSQKARDEFMRGQRDALGSAAVRQAARANLASTATPDQQVPAGLLADPVAYDRLASAAIWQQRSDSTAMLIRLQSTDYQQDRLRLRAIAQALVQANDVHINNERRLRADVEHLTRELESARTQQTELRQLIETEQSLGDSRPRYQAQLAKIDADLEQLENARIAAARALSQVEAELAELRTNMPQITGDDPNAASEVAGDLELRQMQQQLADVTKSLEALRGAGRELADDARRAYDASMEQFQQDIASVRGTLDASPELQAYVESAQGLLEITRRLSEAVLHRQQQAHDRLQSMRQWLEESMRSRRVEMWQKDPELQRLNEQLAFAQRQFNVASSNNLPDEANDARLQIQVLEQKIVERQEQIGNDELALKLVLDLQEMIDATARTMAEDRASGEKMIEEQTQRLQRAAVDKLPAEQRELAAKLEQRLQQIASARRQLASTISGERAAADEQIQKLLEQQTDLTARLEARKKTLADAAAQRLTRQQQQARQDRITDKEAELTAARTQLAETQDKLNVLYRDQRSTMRKIAESSLAGDRVASATTKLQQLQQNMQTWESTLNQRKRELAATVVPREVSDLDITSSPPNDNRLLYFAVSAGLVFLTFSFLIGATIRSALHDVPAPYLPARHIPLAEPLEAPHHDAELTTPDDDTSDDPTTPSDRNPAPVS